MARRSEFVDGLACAIDDDTCIRIQGSGTTPCTGVALRFSAVIDCSPGEGRMPLVTIRFVKSQGSNEPPHTLLAGQFTCNSDEFMLLSRRQEVEAMVAAAGFPPECAPLVDDFCHRSASTAANSFWRAVSITVEMEAPPPAGSHVDDDRADEEDVAAGEPCPICLKECVAGSGAAVQLPCSHAFHRTCLDCWVSVKRTCPYCRSPVPEGGMFLYEDYAESGDEDDDSGEEPPRSMVPDGETWSFEFKLDSMLEG